MARRKKRRTHVPVETDKDTKIPKSFVIKSGDVGTSVSQLVQDVRRVMEPNTATNLKERKGNKLKDFVHVASTLSVTHMMIFSKSDTSIHLRMGRIPRGPTVTFKIESYALTKDVLNLQNKPKSPGSDFKTAPLVVLNNFTDSQPHLKLVTTMLQNIFPPIKLGSIKLADARRVILFDFNSETKMVEFRHYSINVKLTGVSKSVKNLIQTHIPDLNQYDDISNYILKGSMASESDVEDAGDAGEFKVTLPEKYIGKGNGKSEERSIRLVELGPRMELSILKIQSELCDGEVLYHSYIQKTKEEINIMKARRAKKEKDRERRRKEQEKNVASKKAIQAQNKKDNENVKQDEEEDEEQEEDDDMQMDEDQEDSDQESEQSE